MNVYSLEELVKHWAPLISLLVEIQNLYEVMLAPLPEAVAIAFIEVYCTSLRLTLTAGGVALFNSFNCFCKVSILLLKLSNTASKSQTLTAFMLVHSDAGLVVGIGRLMASVLEDTVIVVPEAVKSCAPEKVFPVV